MHDCLTLFIMTVDCLFIIMQLQYSGRFAACVGFEKERGRTLYLPAPAEGLASNQVPQRQGQRADALYSFVVPTGHEARVMMLK